VSTISAPMVFWPASDPGKTRTSNQDSYLVDKKLGLLVVADGMGGHAAGEVASRMAVHEVHRALSLHGADLLAYGTRKDGIGRQDILRLMESAVQQACAVVHADAEANPDRRGMGTTLSALLILGSRGFIAHVGDSRIYLFRQGEAHQLTEDHSLINELIKRGRLTREQISRIEYKNAVTRAVGVYESVEVDTLDLDVLADDRFLLCSDGLHMYFEPEQLRDVVLAAAEDNVGDTLVGMANDRGGEDNITAVVVHIPQSGAAADTLAREVNLKIETLKRMPLFRFLNYQQVVQTLNITEVRQYQDGDEIVREGEAGDELFIVLTGQVRVHSGETTITRFGPGQHFGEMSLVDKSPRSASVSSEQEAQLLVIRRRDFFDLVRSDHSLAVKLLWSFVNVLSQRLRVTSRNLGEAREQLLLEELPHEALGVTELDDS
jgi:PPM family protein phosphatase